MSEHSVSFVNLMLTHDTSEFLTSVSLKYVLGRFLLQGDENSLLLLTFSHLWLYWSKK